MKSAVDDESQVKLDPLRSREPVKTGKRVCDVVRSSKTGSQPSSGIENRLKTARQRKLAGRLDSEASD